MVGNNFNGLIPLEIRPACKAVAAATLGRLISNGTHPSRTYGRKRPTSNGASEVRAYNRALSAVNLLKSDFDNFDKIMEILRNNPQLINIKGRI